ncbi:LuxR family transcriptional regulator [Salinisphaera sp. T5B8]|uniref:helix-turn-helix transcriptional regulator n=1 Tax=Salinisphaera sp. T5B8 TaxID=1304154 RepID=UPI0033421A70
MIWNDLHIPPSISDRIHELWDELAAIPASQPEERLQHLFDTVGALIGSRHGFWLSSSRMHEPSADDPLLGWRARSIHFYGELASDQTAYRQSVKCFDAGRIDESTRNHVHQAGRFRASLLADHVSAAFFNGRHYDEHYRARGIVDRLFVVLPVGEDVESFFIFDRLDGEPDFDHEALAVASYALRSLSWFTRQLHLSYGQLVAKTPLTPTERRVLRRLLSGRAEKAIAHDIDQSPHTTHNYFTNIFRKFNVRSRAELMALWLGHG